MDVLGIWDGHDAGVAWWRDGKYLCCLNEERISREKRQAGFPSLALETLIAKEGLDPSRIDLVAVPGRYGRSIMRFADSRYRAETAGQDPFSVASALVRNADNAISKVPLLRRFESEAGITRVRSRLRRQGIYAPLASVQHHDAHAHTAACTRKRNPLIVTLDGYGDGECGRLAYQTARERTLHVPGDSLALVYGAVTNLLGFCEGDEGKVMGLAAHGDPTVLRNKFQRLLTPGSCCIDLQDSAMRRLLMAAKREDVAAALQEQTEKVALHWIRSVRRDETSLAVSGGLFANVALNGKLQEEFTDVYVFPHMGDGGLCVGAVEAVAQCHSFPEVPFLGPTWTKKDILTVLEAASLSFHESRYPELELAQTIISGEMAARWCGRSAFGPRALGHRSIFIRPDKQELVDQLNTRLGRDEFMPFAPMRRTGLGSKTMTSVFRADTLLREHAPAAVHVDGTCRTQIVCGSADPGLWDMLERTEAAGLPAVINTSFNQHGEPIVESPEDAVRTFVEAGLDRMQLGPFIVEIPR